MCGCSRAATAWASASKRPTKAGSVATCSWNTLTATSRSTWGWMARKTAPSARRRSSPGAGSRGGALPADRVRGLASGPARGASRARARGRSRARRPGSPSPAGRRPAPRPDAPRGRGPASSRPHRLSRQGWRASRVSSSPIARAWAPLARSPSILASCASSRSSSSRAASATSEGWSARSASAGPRHSAKASSSVATAMFGSTGRAFFASLMSASNRAASNSEGSSQAVAGCVALDPVVAEGLPEVRDVGLDDVPGFLGRFFAPDLVDQRLGGHELVRADEQVGEDRALLRPAEGDRPAPRVDLERSEDAELQPPPVHAPRRLPGQERSHLLGDVAPLRSDRQDVDGIGEPLEMQLPAIDVGDAIERASEVNDALTAQDLAGAGLPAQPRREVQGPTPVSALDLNRLARIQPDPHGEREIRSRQRLLQEARLQLDRRPDRLTGRTKDGEGLITPQLDHRAVTSLYLLANDVGEPSCELGSRFVTALMGEVGVSANVRDQERPDLLGAGRRRVSAFLSDIDGARSLGSVLHPPHAAEYRALDSRAPGRRLVLCVAHALSSIG